MGGDGVAHVRADPLEAVDVSACAGRSASELAQVVVVAVRDAVKRQRAVARGAELPASAGLVGGHDDDDVMTLDAAVGLSGDIATPRSGQRSAVGAAECGFTAVTAQIAATTSGRSRRDQTNMAAGAVSPARHLAHARGGPQQVSSRDPTQPTIQPDDSDSWCAAQRSIGLATKHSPGSGRIWTAADDRVRPKARAHTKPDACSDRANRPGDDSQEQQSEAGEAHCSFGP